MTRAEVETVLGPPLVHRNWPPNDWRMMAIFPPPAAHADWENDDYQWTVVYDTAGRMCGTAEEIKPSGLSGKVGRFAWRLKCLWEEWFS
jgi:hypothetical protein